MVYEKYAEFISALMNSALKTEPKSNEKKNKKNYYHYFLFFEIFV